MKMFSCLMVLSLVGSVAADPLDFGAFDARISSLEKRVSALEKASKTATQPPTTKVCDANECRIVSGAVAPQLCGCPNCPAGGGCTAGECGRPYCEVRPIQAPVLRAGEILTHVNGIPIASGSCAGGSCGVQSFGTPVYSGFQSAPVQSFGSGGGFRSGGGIFRGRMSRGGGGCASGNCGG